jgi:hypothetical protein
MNFLENRQVVVSVFNVKIAAAKPLESVPEAFYDYYCAAEAIFCCPTENNHHLEA